MSEKLNNFNTDELLNKENELSKKIKSNEHQIDLIYNFNYEQFYSDMNLFLKKLPNNILTKYVHNLLNNKGVFVGISLKKTIIPLFSRILISKSTKLSGVVLNSQDLDIEISGETNNIDNCIYATYFGIIRAALRCQPDKVKIDYSLHKLAVTYLNNIILKTLGKTNSFNSFQLDGIYLACSYLYLKHYLNLNHSMSVSRMKRTFSDNIEDLEKFLPNFELVDKYKSIKDIGSVLVDLNILTTNPNVLLLGIIQSFGKIFFYNILNSIDYLLATVIITNYPTDLLGKTMIVNNKLQSSIEKYITSEYLEIMKYSIINLNLNKKE